MPPNEDFGKSNKPFGEYFRSTFQREMLRKYSPNGLFDPSEIFAWGLIDNTKKTIRRSSCISNLACLSCFVNPSLQYCDKENSDDHHASRMLLLCLLCFVSPSLQCFYKETIRRSSCISRVVVVVLCKPIWWACNYEMRNKDFESSLVLTMLCV